MSRRKFHMAFGLMNAIITMMLFGTIFTGSLSSQVVRRQLPPTTQRQAVEQPVQATHRRIELPPSFSSLRLRAPSGIQTTVDQTVCSQHGGFAVGLVCHALLPKGRIALVWNPPASPAAQVSGYKIYRVDSGINTLVYTQNNGHDITAWVVDPLPAGGYDGACFAVSAYGTLRESPLSGTVCTSSGQSIQAATFAPVQYTSSQAYHSSDFDARNSTAAIGELVGFEFQTEKSLTGDKYFNSIDQTALLFDLSSLTNKRIVSAHLRMSVDTTLEGSGNTPPTNHDSSCIDKIAVGKARWWKYPNDYADADIVQQGVRQVGPDVSMDVTRIVQGWMTGVPNFGIVLIGPEDDLNVFTEKACHTSYDVQSTQLVVLYRN